MRPSQHREPVPPHIDLVSEALIGSMDGGRYAPESGAIMLTLSFVVHDPERTSTVGEPHMQPIERFSTLPQSIGQFMKLAVSARWQLESPFLSLSATACPGF